jgi:transcriptional regulator with XRE-family HTH domain
LDWKTPSENQFDRFKSGIPQPRWKLTAEQAREIRELKGLERVQDTAARYHINESNVRLIQAGKTWREGKRDLHVFSREDVERVRTSPRESGLVKSLAEEFGVSVHAIRRIRSGETYRHFLAAERPNVEKTGEGQS